MTKEEIQMSLYVCGVLYYAKNLTIEVKQLISLVLYQRKEDQKAQWYLGLVRVQEVNSHKVMMGV